MKQNVFINYRRSDVPIVAQFIESELAKRFGEEHIFFDREIEPGSDFVEVLKEAVANCHILLALIGPAWLNKRNKSRLQLENDWVRIEIATALGRDTKVIPVLVKGAKPPTREDLPEDLHQLVNNQGVFLREDDIWTGMNRLLAVIEKDLGLRKPEEPQNKTDQVDDLLRKARLLKAEADQMYLDQMSRSQQFRFGSEGTSQVDLEQHLGNFDETAHDSKLNESYQLMRKAAQLDPTNTEVMLVTAELLIELTPDDPTDEQKLLFKVKSLISNPKNETEQFQLAKATYLLAFSGEKIHEESLRDAKLTFEQLGRRDYVRQCDELLMRDIVAPEPPEDLAQAAPEPPPIQQQQQTPQQPAQFQPIGSWKINDAAICPSTWTVDFYPNGGFQGQQETPDMGIYGSVNGTWGYDPYQSAFHIQGVLNGFVPFGTSIFIQRFDGRVWYGVGTDGMPYNLTPMGT